ncbi:MAG: hypothetical protein N2235_01555 [Fischerella sp.]|nr:hypothetical protein [Fischerella sp.]
MRAKEFIIEAGWLDRINPFSATNSAIRQIRSLTKANNARYEQRADKILKKWTEWVEKNAPARIGDAEVPELLRNFLEQVFNAKLVDLGVPIPSSLPLTDVETVRNIIKDADIKNWQRLIAPELKLDKNYDQVKNNSSTVNNSKGQFSPGVVLVANEPEFIIFSYKGKEYGLDTTKYTNWKELDSNKVVPSDSMLEKFLNKQAEILAPLRINYDSNK